MTATALVGDICRQTLILLDLVRALPGLTDFDDILLGLHRVHVQETFHALEVA